MAGIITVPELEYRDLAMKLDNFHGIFSQIWQIGIPHWSTEIETAGVIFDTNGECLGFGINKEFWSGCSEYTKLFVICHECLHVLFNHGMRSMGLPKELKLAANIAMDISINHILIERFGFIREQINSWKDLCWKDTVFTPEQVKTLSPNLNNFEYFFGLLRKQGSGDGQNRSGGKQTLLGNHKDMEKNALESKDLCDSIAHSVSKYSQAERTVLDQVLKTEERADDKSSGLHRGVVGGNVAIQIDLSLKPPRKRKWETIIRNWALNSLKLTSKEHEQWVRTNRRFVNSSTSFFIPTVMDVDSRCDKNRIEVWFFLDTSGSCSHLAKRFFDAARTLPPERFKIRLFCFDTRVYETSLSTGKLYGFGGTSFTCINEYINRQTANTAYPQAVFIITDGYGDSVHPKHPNKWYWFLSENYRACIPSSCNIFNLKDFE